MDVGNLIEKVLQDQLDPINALRELAMELSRKGYAKKAIYDLFFAKYVELQQQGRETEENLLGDVMDMIVDEYPPRNLHLP